MCFLLLAKLNIHGFSMIYYQQNFTFWEWFSDVALMMKKQQNLVKF